MKKSANYGLLGFLTVINILNFIDRQLLTSFSNFIVPDLGLTNTQFGFLTGFAFIIFYSLMGLFMGTIADRVHRPRFISFGLALWSILTALSGMAKSFWMLFIPRIFIGIGESILTPTALSLLSDRFPKRNMGFVAGVYYLAVPLGVSASLFTAGYLGPILGWRNCFYLLGLLGLVFALFMLWVKETPHRQRDITQQPSSAVINRKNFHEAITILRTSLQQYASLKWTIYGGIAVHFILGAMVFEQLWFVEEKGFEKAEIARIAGFMGLTGGVMGNIFGGIAGDYYAKVTGQGRQMFLFWCILLFVPANIIYRITDDNGFIFFTCMFLGFFQWGCIYGPVFSSVQEMTPVRIRAVIVAYYLLMVNIIGLGFGITLSGIMIDYLISQGSEEPYSVTLLSFQLLSGLSLPALYYAGKNYKSDREQMLAQENISSSPQ